MLQAVNKYSNHLGSKAVEVDSSVDIKYLGIMVVISDNLTI